MVCLTQQLNDALLVRQFLITKICVYARVVANPYVVFSWSITVLVDRIFWRCCICNGFKFLVKVTGNVFALTKFYMFIYCFISFLLKVDLHQTYERANKRQHSNSLYISANELPNNNDESKTKYLVVKWNQQNRFYITYITLHGQSGFHFFFFFWKILDFYKFSLSRQQVTIFSELYQIRSLYHISQNCCFYFEVRFIF